MLKNINEKIIDLALNGFEDGLQYFNALENSQDIIITRNLKDFKGSKLPILTAKQFIETINWDS